LDVLAGCEPVEGAGVFWLPGKAPVAATRFAEQKRVARKIRTLSARWWNAHRVEDVGQQTIVTNEDKEFYHLALVVVGGECVPRVIADAAAGIELVDRPDDRQLVGRPLAGVGGCRYVADLVRCEPGVNRHLGVHRPLVVGAAVPRLAKDGDFPVPS